MERLLLVGFDDAEAREILDAAGLPGVAHTNLPRIVVEGDTLLTERRQGPGMLPVSRVLFHGIFEDDLDFLGGLALWGGPCLPNARALLDCRLKVPCLLRALDYTRFKTPGRGYVSPGARYVPDGERVAKWGNWHCGENKERFSGSWESEEACLIEPFLPGRSVRIVVLAGRAWQIALAGADWRKSIHADDARFEDADPELLADARAVAEGFGLEMLANDYIVTDAGTKHLLEVNHIPNVTRFPELWAAYQEFALVWLRGRS
jgi:hypothetical protein